MGVCPDSIVQPNREKDALCETPSVRESKIRLPLLLFPFPSQYLFTIGHMMFLAFDDGSPIFKQRSSMRRSTGHRIHPCPPTRLSRRIVGHFILLQGPDGSGGNVTEPNNDVT